jgi:transcription elongation factor Elf1
VTRATITRERADRIARAQACVGCKEYTYRKVTIARADAGADEALGEKWHATLTCGVCGVRQELGLSADGEVLYVG